MTTQNLELSPKSIAVAMRVAGYKHKDIAKTVGVTTRTIQKWFK